MPEISVVLPSFNGEKYLGESIESVRSQKFKDWELIIVDDCSTDSTPDIAEEYAKKDSRIVVHHNKENLKLPASLNVGFHMARGNYLTWTSDDNLYLSYALEDMHTYLEAHPNEAMVCADEMFIDADKRFAREHPRYDDKSILLDSMLGACFLYRRDVLKTVGDYDESLFCAEDYDYWLRIIKCYGEIGYLPGVRYLYRIHSGRLSETKQAQVLQKMGELWEKHKDWLPAKLPEGMRAVAYYYYGIMSSIDAATKQWAESVQPGLAYEKPLEANAKIILYGTGEYGVRALSLIGKRAVAFTKSSNRPGAATQKCGLPIIPFEDAVRMCKEEGHQIVIAAGVRYIPEMMENLLAFGLKEYSFYPRLLGGNQGS